MSTKFEKCESSLETTELVKSIVSKVPLSKVQKDLSKQFHNAEKTIEVLYHAFTTGSNAILYGPGGFGKTEITSAFLRYFKIPSFVKVGYSGMDVEALLGIPNIKKLMDESEYKVAFEKSVFNNSGVLVLEEFLDVKPTVAAALKDILTSGGLRDGDNLIPSKIGPVIICSNKSPDDVSTDDSTAAFYKERFPLSLYVTWDNFRVSDFMKLYELSFGEEHLEDLRLIAEICAVSGEVSPRIALKAAQIFITSESLDAIQYVGNLNMSRVEFIQEKLRVEKLAATVKVEVEKISDVLDDTDFGSLQAIARYRIVSESLKDVLRSGKFIGDELLEEINSAIFRLEMKDGEAKVLLAEFGKNAAKLSKLEKIYEKIEKFERQL